MPDHPVPSLDLAGAPHSLHDVESVLRTLSITTVEPIEGWASLEKIVYEHLQPGSYRESVRRQQRETVTVQLLMRGRLRWRLSGAKAWRTVEPGQALVYDAGQHGDLEYEGDPEGGHLEFLYANLSGTPMRAAVAGLLARSNGHTVPVHSAEELIKRWSAKLSENANAPSHRCLSVVEASELAWSFLLPLARGLAPFKQLAEKAMALLTENWQDPPNMSVLAKRLHVSREHLARVLRSTCGQPPGVWLRRYRLGRAADLLESGQSIQAVAEACGYCTVPHFIHAFRRVLGSTPGRWLRDKRG